MISSRDIVEAAIQVLDDAEEQGLGVSTISSVGLLNRTLVVSFILDSVEDFIARIVPLIVRYNDKLSITMREEKRIFGQRPRTTGLALRNLPDGDHPLASSDLSIQHLAALRKVLVQSILHYLGVFPFPISLFPTSLVENKMVPLTYEDVALMEIYSFYRSELVGVESFRAPDIEEGHIWETLFPLIKDPLISVWTMSPWDIEAYPLVLIESHEPEDLEFPFTMGVVTQEEYASLTRELDEVLYGLACEQATRRRQYNPE